MWEILGIIGVLLLLIVSVIVLPLLGHLLKSLNKGLVTRGPDFKKQVNDSMIEIQDVDKEIEALVDFADRHFVVEKGEVAWRGTTAELVAEPSIQETYLGV